MYILSLSHLKVDDNAKDENGGHQVGQVWQVLSVEGLTQSTNLIRSGSQEMKQRNDGTFELCTPTCVDGSWTEWLPDDSFTDVGGDKERDTGAKTVAFLEKLIQKENN